MTTEKSDNEIAEDLKAMTQSLLSNIREFKKKFKQKCRDSKKTSGLTADGQEDLKNSFYKLETGILNWITTLGKIDKNAPIDRNRIKEYEKLLHLSYEYSSALQSGMKAEPDKEHKEWMRKQEWTNRVNFLESSPEEKGLKFIQTYKGDIEKLIKNLETKVKLDQQRLTPGSPKAAGSIIGGIVGGILGVGIVAFVVLSGGFGALALGVGIALSVGGGLVGGGLVGFGIGSYKANKDSQGSHRFGKLSENIQNTFENGTSVNSSTVVNPSFHKLSLSSSPPCTYQGEILEVEDVEDVEDVESESESELDSESEHLAGHGTDITHQ